MNHPVQDLLNLLDLKSLDNDLYHGYSIDIGTGRVYGGQVLAQSIMAASRSVDDRHLHSMHGYFLRPGDLNLPILYRVERIRDGASFTSRRVIAIQEGKEIFTGILQFHITEAGPAHQQSMPTVPGPEHLKSDLDVRKEIAAFLPKPLRDFFTQDRAVEFRFLNEGNFFQSKPNQSADDRMWMRINGVLPDDPVIHQACLAYASDFALLHTAMRPHGLTVMDTNVQAASLDHSMWFHHEARFDEWMLYATESPFAGSARGLCHGQIYSTDGRLIASVSQEGLIRLLPTDHH